MGQKYFCDRCGAVYKDKSAFHTVKIYDSDLYAWELCEDCIDECVSWMDMKNGPVAQPKFFRRPEHAADNDILEYVDFSEV